MSGDPTVDAETGGREQLEKDEEGDRDRRQRPSEDHTDDAELQRSQKQHRERERADVLSEICD